MSPFTAPEAWAFKYLLAGNNLNGQLPLIAEPWRSLASLLDSLPAPERLPPWQGALALRPDHDVIRQAILAADLNAGMPTTPTTRRFATGEDVRKTILSARWLCPAWIPADSPWGVAALEGTGKTRFLLDLHRRIQHGINWPDGQPMTLAPGPFLWICADGHQAEIVDIAEQMGIPLDEIIFPAPPDDWRANTSIDEQETWDWIRDATDTYRPVLSILDTLTYATSMDLCKQDSVAKIKIPLIDLCQSRSISFCLSLHVSREGEALGRRIKGLTRTLIKIECPDPENASDRLRVWVDKSFDKKPDPLGCTIHADRMEYDSAAPPRASKATGNPPGRNDHKCVDAMQFVVAELSKSNDQIGNDLAGRWQGGSPDTCWRAIKKLIAAGTIVTTGGKGTGQQTTLHLVSAPQTP